MIFEPFQESSGFSDGISKTSEKVPKQCWSLFVLQALGGVTDFGKTLTCIGGLIPLKKPEREGCVSHSHVHCLDVSFVITSVSANEFSYFLFLLFCPSKSINFKTFVVGES